jgi:hypothetical protein
MVGAGLRQAHHIVEAIAPATTYMSLFFRVLTSGFKRVIVKAMLMDDSSNLIFDPRLRDPLAKVCGTILKSDALSAPTGENRHDLTIDAPNFAHIHYYRDSFCIECRLQLCGVLHVYTSAEKEGNGIRCC